LARGFAAKENANWRAPSAKRFLSSCLFEGGPENSLQDARAGQIRISGGQMKMRQTLIRSSFLILTLLAAGVVMASAQTPASSPTDIRKDRRDIRHDRKDIRSDRRELNADARDRRTDVRDYRDDKKDGASKQELRSDRRDIASDTRDVRHDRRDVRRDVRDRRVDRRDLRRDRRGR